MILEVERINSFYGTSHVLFDLSLKVEHGKLVTLLGRNGAGKSTTIKSVMGLIAPKSGSIRFKGEEIRGKDPWLIAKAGVGYVPEERRIFPNLTVQENLMVARKNHKMDNNSWSLERIYSVFSKLEQLKSHQGRHLSGGEQQMLSVARTLMGNPEMLLLDEPSEGLAPVIVQVIGQILDRIKEDKLTVLLSEQNVHFALMHSDYAYVIDDGRMCFEGTIEELENDKDTQCRYLAL